MEQYPEQQRVGGGETVRPSRGLRAAGCCLLALLLAACAGGRVVSAYEADSPATMHQLLLLLPGLSLVPEKDAYAREQLVAALRERGIDVVTRDAYFSASEPITHERVISELAGTEIDGVLLVMPGRVTMESRGNQNFIDSATGYVNFEDEISQLFSTGGRLSPEVRGDDTYKELEAHLFSVAGEALVWARTLSFNNPGSWLDVLDRASPLVARELERSGLVVAGTP